MPRLVTTAPLRYAARNLRAGEAFDASAADARVLRAIGRAADPPPVAAAVDINKPPDDDAGAVRGRYRRRDMRADA